MELFRPPPDRDDPQGTSWGLALNRRGNGLGLEVFSGVERKHLPE